MKFLLLSFLLFAITPKTEALYCADLKKLVEKAKSCDENEYFSEAAVLCLQALEAQVAVATKAMEKSLQRPGVATAQNKSVGASEANYQMSKATLDRLLAQAKGGAAEVLNMSKHVVLPEDADNPEITKGKVDDFLASVDCYSRADKVMNKVLGRYLSHILNLEKARGASAGFQATTDLTGKNLDNSTLPGSAVDPKKMVKPGPAGPKGKDWKASDISGTEEKPKQ